MIKERAMNPPISGREAVRASLPGLKKTLGWAGLALSWVTTVTLTITIDRRLRPGKLPWIGALVGVLIAALLTWGQWVLTPFGRRRPDLEKAGMIPIRTLTLLEGYLDPTATTFHPVYSWRKFLTWLVVFLAPDLLISHFQSFRYTTIPLITSDWTMPLVWIVAVIVGMITAAASIGPENVIFKGD